MSLTPITSVTYPLGARTRGTVRYRTPPEMLVYQDFSMLSRKLQGMDMQVIYISPDNQLFHLHGKDAGREGIRLNTQLQGEQHWPFELVTTKGAYIYGAEIERVNVNERMINFGIIVGGDSPRHLTGYQYHLAEDHWWNSQDENRDGWLGIFTRFSGWRWIKVRPFGTVDTPQKKSPMANDQNTAMWDVKWIAGSPFYSKVTFRDSWTASLQNMSDDPDDPRPFKGTITLANRGDLPSPVKYIVSSPGHAAVSDNGEDRIVELPITITSDGPYLVDTESGHRTLTAATERVDTFWYKRARAAKLLDYALHDLESLGEPLGYRFNQRFIYTVPPRSVAHLKVEHSQIGGSVIAYLPQRYKRSR
jgi:hypothetical protein